MNVGTMVAVVTLVLGVLAWGIKTLVGMTTDYTSMKKDVQSHDKQLEKHDKRIEDLEEYASDNTNLIKSHITKK